MGVNNQQKTVKSIFKNLENTKGFENFKPNWMVNFTDGTKAKLPLEQKNAEEICGKLTEGRSYLFTLEDGTYNDKPWIAIRDVLASGGIPEPKQPLPSTPSAPAPSTPSAPKEVVLNPQTIGLIWKCSVELVTARIKAGVGKSDPASIKTDIEYFNKYFEEMMRSGKLWVDF